MVRQHALLRLAGRPTFFQRQALRYPTSLRRNITVLGIETSADDTCVALLRIDRGKTNNTVYTLYEDRVSCANTKHRGIHPVEAVASHTQHLSRMIQELVQKVVPAVSSEKYVANSHGKTASSQEHGLSLDDQPPHIHGKPDLIAVTRGPGMGGCLSVGVITAKTLSVIWSVPIIGVHHMQAHALTPMMEAAMARGLQRPVEAQDDPKFPFLTLLISGKHTMLVHTKSTIEHRILASAEDIAMGDVLDKCAREIVPDSFIPAGTDTLVYPKLMEQFVASDTRVQAYAAPVRDRTPKIYESEHGWNLPPPARLSREMKYNFTGLGGHVRKIMMQRPDMDDEERRELAIHTMRLAFEHVMSRVVMALREDEDLVAHPPSTLVLSGGVASNRFLRKVAEETLRARGFPRIRVIAPAIRYCTDNAPMIAFAGGQMYNEGWVTDNAFTCKVKWSIEEILSDADCWVRRPGYLPPSDGEETTEVVG